MHSPQEAALFLSLRGNNFDIFSLGLIRNTKELSRFKLDRDPVQLAVIPVQAESQLQTLELVARGTGLYMNSDKTEFMCSEYDSTLSTLNDKPLT